MLIIRATISLQWRSNSFLWCCWNISNTEFFLIDSPTALFRIQHVTERSRDATLCHGNRDGLAWFLRSYSPKYQTVSHLQMLKNPQSFKSPRNHDWCWNTNHVTLRTQLTLHFPPAWDKPQRQFLGWNTSMNSKLKWLFSLFQKKSGGVGRWAEGGRWGLQMPQLDQLARWD